jgi:hypothetical protein
MEPYTNFIFKGTLLEMESKSRFRKRNSFPNLSLRAPERCVAISLEKARLLRFARKDGILNRDLGGGLMNEEVHMKCYRCSSDMVYEKFYGPQEHFWGWRCIFCGEIIDQVILENRKFIGAEGGRSTNTQRK